jgi:hypothetical protein
MKSRSKARSTRTSWIPYGVAAAILAVVYVAGVLGFVEVPYLVLRAGTIVVGGLAVAKQLREASPKRRRELQSEIRRGERIGLAVGLIFLVVVVVGGLLSK